MTFSRRRFIQQVGAGALASIPLAESMAAFASTRAVANPAEIPSSPLRLDRNENAYGPFPSVPVGIQSSLQKLNRYPDRIREQLIHALADHHHTDSGHIALGCGSTEILRAAADTFLGRGRVLLTALPTFPAITEYATASGAQIVTVPLNKYFEFDLPAMLAKVSQATTLVYICTPNNPTATLTPRASIERFIKALPANTYVLIDEAYHEFVEPSGAYYSFIDRPLNDSRVIVTRTFSKIFGLAGLRVGYAVADPKVAARLRRRLTRNDLNVVAAQAAITSLDDGAALRAAIQRNADDRQEFINEATGRRLKPLPSHTNFMTFDTTVPAMHVVEHFKKHDVLIAGPFPNLNRYVRVSLAKENDMLEFWRVWDLLGIHPQGHH